MHRHTIPVVLLAGVLLLPATADPQAPGSRPAPPGAPSLGRAVHRNGGTPAAAPAYAVRPPEGMLPWPHHAPGFTQAQYDDMMARLFIVNNFALVQGGADGRGSVYFHTGLDVVRPNGTPIHAIASGTIRAIIGSPPYYLSIIVEDAGEPGWAWGYTHVLPERGMVVGTAVTAGTVLARISFQGLEHLHLSRTFLKAGEWSSMFNHASIDPTPYFDFVDTEAPVIEPGFYYFLNESHTMFPRGRPTLVSGEVDIVAGVRDPGEYGRGALPGSPNAYGGAYGNRNTPHRLHVSIAAADDPDRVLWSQTAIDFSSIILDHRPPVLLQDPDRVETIYAYRPETNPNFPRDYNAIFSYYFLTNRSRAGDLTMIEATDGQPAWETAAVDGNGRRLFPDGDYIVTVTAWDAKGNRATAQDTVAVLNR